MKKIKSIISKLVLGLAIMLIVLIPLLSEKINAQTLPTCPEGQVMVNNVCVDIAQGPDNNAPLPNSPAGQGNYPETPGSNTTANPNDLTITPNNAEDYKKGYELLAPLDGFKSFDTTQTCAFGRYLDIVIKLFIGICAVLAVIIIVVGGIEYMTSELVSSKEHGKGQMTQAVLGLILALSAWLILDRLNPKLLELCLDQIPNATPIAIEGDEASIPFAALTNIAEGKFNVYCPGSGGVGEIKKIAQSFAKKVTYSQSKRGSYDASSIYLDCSSFVAQVYECAKLDLPGTPTTLGMLAGQENITNITGTKVNGVELQIGDVLGWTKGESKKFPRAGHVVIYIGGGSFIEVSGGSGPGGAVHIRPLSHYIKEFRHIIRANLT